MITEESKTVEDDPNNGLENAPEVTIGADGQSVWYAKPAENQIAALTPR